MATRDWLRRVAATLGPRLDRLSPFATSSRVDKGAQLLLAAHYRDRADQRRAPLPFAEVGFRNYSQADEDGILLYLFATIGTTNRMAVEMSVEDGIECNSANLVIAHGWDALLVDGSQAKIARGQRFYRRHADTWLRPPRLVHAWIDADRVNAILHEQGISGEVDLFSLDIDGVDYWVLKGLKAISPRVIVVEYRESWGAEERRTVPYDPAFDRFRHHPEYFGASLAAFTSVASEKGYRLVGCNRYRNNAFFVRNDVAPDLLPEVPVAACTTLPRLNAIADTRLPVGTHFEWQTV